MLVAHGREEWGRFASLLHLRNENMPDAGRTHPKETSRTFRQIRSTPAGSQSKLEAAHALQHHGFAGVGKRCVVVAGNEERNEQRA
jgi:hypothetical protein